MYSAQYSKRLVDFNSTEKYKAELAELERLLQLEPHHIVLDYGCGIGTALTHLNSKAEVYGYDVNTFEDSVIPEDKIWTGGDDKFDRIYFMHSIAHIFEVKELLTELKENNLAPGGKIVVMTPNKSWLMRKNGRDFKSDDTVIEHFTNRSLYDLFNQAGMMCEYVGQFSYDKASDVIFENIRERLCLVASNP